MRWIGLIVGLAAALVAGWALLSSLGGDDLPTGAAPSRSAPSEGPADEIDEASRERLRAILRGSEAESE
ncbi:MAG: hypothetical protein VCC02_00355 [Myxococcota bacterium]